MRDKNIKNILKDFLLLFYFIFKHKCKIQIDHSFLYISMRVIPLTGFTKMVSGLSTAKEKTGNLNNEDNFTPKRKFTSRCNIKILKSLW
jgi:hypothetical protein